MSDFPLNSQARAIVRIKDVTGTLINATVVTVTFTRPDATTTAPSVTNDSVGIYRADVTLNQAGTWTLSESSTGVVTAGSTTFTVA